MLDSALAGLSDCVQDDAIPALERTFMHDAEAIHHTVSDLLRLHSSAFTDADRKVVRALRADYPRAGLESLPKLAARSGVSGPTVLRMLAKLGYGTYGEFQTALHDEVTARMSQPAARAREAGADGGSDPVHDAMAALKRTIPSTADRVDMTEFRNVVDLLCTTRRPVMTLGGFESEVCASHLATLLSQIRSGVRYVRRGTTASVFEILDVRKQTVVVAFDFRRYQTSTMDALDVARRRHASIVLFTDRWISPAADFADHVFVCDTSGVGPFDSRVSCIALIETLVAAVTDAIGDKGESRIEDVYALMLGSTWAENLSPDPATAAADREA